MVKKFISEKFLESKAIAGIECCFISSSELKFRFVLLNKENGKIIIQSASENLINSIEKLIELIPPSTPLCLTISGSVLIHRKIHITTDEDNRTLLNKILPNTQTNDFYIQRGSVLADGSSFVSIIRKNVLDQMLTQLLQKGFFIFNCTLGPFGVEPLFSLLSINNKNEDYAFSSYNLHIIQSRIFDFKQEDFNTSNQKIINVGGEEINENLLISFASAFNGFFNGGNSLIEVDSVKKSKEEFNQKEQFQLRSWGFLMFFFLLLLINFFVFNHYSKEKNRLQSEISFKQDQLKQFEFLQYEIAEKQKLIEAAGLLDASKTSFYADQIALNIPHSIFLNDLNIQPIKRKIGSEGDRISFSPKVILISGSCRKSYELNDWINALKTSKWVSNLSIVNYNQDKDDGFGKFSLELKIR